MSINFQPTNFKSLPKSRGIKRNYSRSSAHNHPSFFISKKVQVEWPELDSGGNACVFNEILKYGKLEIGLRRDIKDFAIFLIYFRFIWDSNSGPLDPKVNVLTIRPWGQRGAREKNCKYGFSYIKSLKSPWDESRRTKVELSRNWLGFHLLHLCCFKV